MTPRPPDDQLSRDLAAENAALRDEVSKWRAMARKHEAQSKRPRKQLVDTLAALTAAARVIRAELDRSYPDE